MKREMWIKPSMTASAVALALAAVAPSSQAVETIELDEAFARIEINASDGDAGFHGKLDGDGWKRMKIKRPDGEVIFRLVAQRNMKEQGVTENFFESTEPLCFDPTLDDDPENDDEEFQTLPEFLERFPEGVYKFRGVTNEGDEVLVGEYDLSHELPAAPDIEATEAQSYPGNKPVVISWAEGDDLGNCSDPILLPMETEIIEPTDEVELWEVTVEPADDEAVEAAGLLKTVFTTQLAPDQYSVTVSKEYFQPYLDAGISEFKFEVGAKYQENLTFSEGEFTVGPPQ